MFQKPYARLYDKFHKDKPYKKEIQFVYKWGEKPSSIFDIGCGTASYWKHYPAGTKLFGVDKSRAMASKAKNIVCAEISKFKTRERFDCATALFDVINYIPRHDWWKNIPVKKGGYFIFDVWNKKKVDKDGFKDSVRVTDGIIRYVRPLKYDGKKVDLQIRVCEYADFSFTEKHRMYLYSHEDIRKFCGKEFEIVDVKQTKSWQTWYRCKRK